VANAAAMSGFDPVVTSDDGLFREQFHAEPPGMVVLDLGMPGMDGVELLESAFRLGEAHGLNMVGPLEKPVRLEALEAVLNEHRPAPAP
jgi:CheY-like chemotaxis protein